MAGLSVNIAIDMVQQTTRDVMLVNLEKEDGEDLLLENGFFLLLE